MRLVRTIQAAEDDTAIALLTAAVPELSKGRLKDAMNKGAVQLLAKPQKRLRRVQHPVKAGQRLSLHYDAELLARVCTGAVLLHDLRHYSVWFKPAGMLSQGNEWGDHLSLLRVSELMLQPARPVLLVHRLDREASGLMLLAHSKAAAAAFSQLIARRQIDKEYLIRVKGQLAQQQGSIEQPLDGKEAQTRYQLLQYEAVENCSWVKVNLISGRKHQIRRHFDAIGHPVCGDPQYGRGNKDSSGLALQAVRLAFLCPFSKRQVDYALPATLQINSIHPKDQMAVVAD